MIEKMQGRIGFDSVEGKGARFFVALPLLPTQEAQAASEPDDGKPSENLIGKPS